MTNQLPTPQEDQEEIKAGGECNLERVLSTLNLIEKGVKQSFIDHELGIDETKRYLDDISQAKESCQAGDENACGILNRLVKRLTNP